ncbi:MAG: hypothetical protein H0S85_08210 [Desulfovibrionaceae bacterium]|jgi:hypothetical protein|nr:hypothetical protein [Desulfovibrionaceae bacterium]
MAVDPGDFLVIGNGVAVASRARGGEILRETRKTMETQSAVSEQLKVADAIAKPGDIEAIMNATFASWQRTIERH